jgi:hypothetical protein
VSTESPPDSAQRLEQSKSYLTDLMAISLPIAHYALLFIFRKPLSDSFAPLSRLWGFDSVASMPFWYLVGFYGVVMAACSANGQRRITELISAVEESRVVESIKRNKSLAFILISFLFSLLCYSVRTQYASLGEGESQLAHALGRDFETTRYLSEVSIYRFQRLLNGFLGIDPGQSPRLYGAIGGFAFVWLSLLVSDMLGSGLLKKGVIALLTIGSGSVLVFFGGYDTSVLGVVAVLSYVYAGLMCIQKKTPVVVPLLVACTCAAADLRLLALLPSSFVLYYFGHIKARSGLSPRAAELLTIGVLTLLPVGYVIALSNGWGSLLPLFAPREQSDLMTLLEFRHLWEVLNVLVLLSGGAIFFLMILAYRVVRGSMRLDAVSWFLGTLLLFLLALAFVSDAPRGSWDWPAFSFCSLVCILIVAYGLTNASTILSPGSSTMSRAVLPLTFFNVLVVIPWIVVNASSSPFEKLEEMIIGDPASYYRISSQPYLEMTVFCTHNGFQEQAFLYAKVSEMKYPNDPRSYYNDARLQRSLNRNQASDEILKGMIANFPQYPLAYRDLISSYEQNGRMTEIYGIVDKIYAEFVKNPLPFLQALGREQMRIYLFYLAHEERTQKNYPAKVDSIQSWIKSLDEAKVQ